MKSKRKILFSVIFALISIVFCFGLTACDTDADADKTLIKLTNDVGFVVDGGGFAEGSVLEASVIDSGSEDYKQAITLIASESYDKTKTVYVFEISVKKDNVKVQPNGKVKVSVPINEDLSGYDVLHVKDDEKIERLTVTYDNGIATFETESFSKFIFVANETVSPVPDTPAEPDSPNPDTNDTAEAGSQAEWDKAINYWKAQNNVKVVEHISSPLYPEDLGAQIMIYQLDGTAYNEDGYFENDDKSKGKGKGYYIVKDGEVYSRYESYDDGVTWYKTSLTTGYEGQLERTIYGCSNLEDEQIDFSYENFNYDSSNNTYTYKDNENITVVFEFKNDNLAKVIITRYREDDSVTFVRTITFGDAVVEVPTDAIEG